jgi:hypothetical protein
MADRHDKRDLAEQRVTRLRLTNLGKSPRKMVDVIIPEGTPVYRVDKDFHTFALLRTWIVELPEEILYKYALEGMPVVELEEDEPDGG